MMECPFQVGDEITLAEQLKDADLVVARLIGATLPAFGTVYTVRSLTIVDGSPGVQLKEIGYVDPISREDGSYRADFFRKVEKPKTQTSIEIFRKIDREVFSKEPVKT